MAVSVFAGQRIFAPSERIKKLLIQEPLGQFSIAGISAPSRRQEQVFRKRVALIPAVSCKVFVRDNGRFLTRYCLWRKMWKRAFFKTASAASSCAYACASI